MTDSPNLKQLDEAGLDQLVAEYMRRVDGGEEVDVAAFLAPHPDLADVFRQYLDDAATVDRAVGSAPDRVGRAAPSVPPRTEAEASTQSRADHETIPPGTAAVRGSNLVVGEVGSAASNEGSCAETETLPPRPAPAETMSLKADSRPALSEQFGRYRIVKQLGQGAMGAVFLAEDSELRRQVALKVPKFAQAEEPELLERFYREAQAAAIRLWKPEGTPGPVLKGCTAPAIALSWSPDSRWLASSRKSNAGDGVCIWQVGSEPTKPLKLNFEQARRLAWSPDSKRLGFGDDSRGLVIASVDGAPIVIDFNLTPLSCVAWGPDGQHLASSAIACKTRIWNANGKLKRMHDWTAHALAWHPNARRLAASKNRGVIVLETDSTPEKARSVPAFDDWSVRAVGWSRDGKVLACGGEDGVVRLLERGKASAERLTPTQLQVTHSSWSPDSRKLALSSNDAVLRSWDMAAGYPEWSAFLFKDGTSATFSAAGEVIDGDPVVLKKQIVYVVQRTPDGPQELLSYDEFQKLVP